MIGTTFFEKNIPPNCDECFKIKELWLKCRNFSFNVYSDSKDEQNLLNAVYFVMCSSITCRQSAKKAWSACWSSSYYYVFSHTFNVRLFFRHFFAAVLKNRLHAIRISCANYTTAIFVTKILHGLELIKLWNVSEFGHNIKIIILFIAKVWVISEVVFYDIFYE